MPLGMEVRPLEMVTILILSAYALLKAAEGFPVAQVLLELTLVMVAVTEV